MFLLKKVRSRFSFETDLSPSTEIFIRENNFQSQSANKDRQRTFLCFRNFLLPKSLWIGAGTRITVFVENVLSHCTEKFQTRTLLCFGIFQLTKSFMHMRKISRLSMGNLLFDSTEKFIWGTLWCVNNFRYRKFFCLTRIGHDSPSNTFCITVPEYFA